MKSVMLALAAAAINVAALNPSEIALLLPTDEPSGPQDSWECAVSTYTTFFSPPLPTGAVSTALFSYGDELNADCTKLGCPYPDATRWCGFTTAAPTAVLPAYTSYASSASTWWAKHKSSAVALAEECPQYWYTALTNEPAAATWLNFTIANAECIGKEPNGDVSSVTPSSLQPSPTSSALSSRTSVSSPTSTTSSSAGTALSPNGM